MNMVMCNCWKIYTTGMYFCTCSGLSIQSVFITRVTMYYTTSSPNLLVYVVENQTNRDYTSRKGISLEFEQKKAVIMHILCNKSAIKATYIS